MKTIKYESMPGYHISTCCKEAVEIAQREFCHVEFDFNDIALTATPDTDPDILAKSYSDECDRRRRERQASPEYKAEQEAYRARKRQEREALESALLDAPKNMTLRDAEGWRKACDANQDSYGGGVMTYAERWARLMEGRMVKGARIADIAKECSRLADVEGITGFMYGCAVGILAQVWIHGEALRLWHNLATQISDEGERANESGGVLNPALISIGQKQFP
jgi:hypothetical protein